MNCRNFMPSEFRPGLGSGLTGRERVAAGVSDPEEDRRKARRW